MSDNNLGLRHRAALCHLSAFPILTSIWLPLLIKRVTNRDQEETLEAEFIEQHANGAAVYQALCLLFFLIAWLCRTLPFSFMSEVSGNLLLAFLGVIALCVLGVYFLGAVYLAMVAWNGDPFWAPIVGWLLGYEPPSEE